MQFTEWTVAFVTDSPPVVTAVTPAVAVDCQPYCIGVSPLVQSVLGSTPAHCCLKIMHTLDSCSLAGHCGAGTFYVSLLARQAVRAVNTICQLWHCCLGRLIQRYVSCGIVVEGG